MPIPQSASRASIAGPQRSSGRRGGPQRSSGRCGAQSFRVANMHRGATMAAATKNARGKVRKSCAWPAFAQSAAKAEAEAVAAVSSLYADELKPFGRILRKRVAEKILESQGIVADITNLDVLPEVDPRQVRAVCDACELLRIAEEEGGDWSAVFVDRPPTFVDIYSPTDCYHEQFWSGLRVFFEGPHGRDMLLPGGRYACAQALKALELPLLAGFSLGRICHVVQLAMSQKKIFGYMDGAMVPYARSQGMIKDQCAIHGQPSTGNINGQSSTSTLPIASLEVARKHLCDILDTANGEVPLSNVKRLFRSRFQLDLSETSFGCSKLSELLQDSKFSDICRVELRGHGYTVVQVGKKGDCHTNLLQDCSHSVPPVDAPMTFIPTSVSTEAMDQAATQWSLSPSEHIDDDYIVCSVQRTFLQYKVPQTPLPGSRRRSQSLPKDMFRSDKPLVSETPLPRSNTAFACYKIAMSKDVDTDESTPDGSDVESLSHNYSSSNCSAGFSSDEPSFGHTSQVPLTSLSANHGDTMKGIATPKSCEAARCPATFCSDKLLRSEESRQALVPTAASDRDFRLPTALTLLEQNSLHAEETVNERCTIGSDSARRRVIFCPDEPLEFEEAGCISTSPQLSPNVSSSSILLPADVPPSPVRTPSPLTNYSNLANWHQPPVYPSLPRVLPILLLAVPPSSNELGCTQNHSFMVPIGSELLCAGTIDMLLPAQPGSSCSSTLHALRQPLHPGRIIRLGEHI